MIVEYLDSFVSDHLRMVERLISAFWGRAPALTHFGTMVSMLLLGEARSSSGLEPQTQRQRLALLYLMEAVVRRSLVEFASERPAEKRAGAAKLDDACDRVLPEMPRLMEVCRPEEQKLLLISHVCKLLVEYAVENSRDQVLVNTTPLCKSICKTMEHAGPMDTIKYSVDALLTLARRFDEPKRVCFAMAQGLCERCGELLQPKVFAQRADEVRLVLSRLVVLSSRMTDMTFGKEDMVERMVELLHARSAWPTQAAGEATGGRRHWAETADGHQQGFQMLVWCST